MDFAAILRRYDVQPAGLLHCGAHLAEEAPLYQATGCEPVWWVEANPHVAPKLRRILADYPQQSLINALVYSEEDELMDFAVTNYDGMSSSLLTEFGTHTEFSPDTVFVDTVNLRTRTIDSLVKEYGVQANILSTDLQGADGFALQGATEFLRGVDLIIAEVNSDEVYVGCMLIDEYDDLLAKNGFKRVETHWVEGQGWGDAAAVRVQ